MKQQMIAHSNNTTPYSEIHQGNLITSCQTTKATLTKLHQQQVAHLHLLLLLQDLELFGDLMKVNMKPLMDWIVKRNSDTNGSLGYLPAMCRNSACQLGALNSQSFVERMNSAANLIVTKKRTNLADELIDKLVVIRMNRNFMMHCRQNKPITHVNLSQLN